MDEPFSKNNELFKSSDGVKSELEIEDEELLVFQIDHAGISKGSGLTDFYVYEAFIKETGEFFYVGKGRENAYKEYHKWGYEAERIIKQFDTEIKFVAENLTEEQAEEIVSTEMARILDKTNNKLTNRDVFFQDSGYSRSPSTPPYMFETAPVLYTCEVDKHYFNYKSRPFDSVEYENLARPAFIEKIGSREEISIIYGDEYEKYYKEVISLLEQNGSKIIKTRYAKSVTAWIYPFDDRVMRYELDEAVAQERLGRRIPAYHLIDIWKFLKARFGETETQNQSCIEISPIHSRVPLSQIRNLHNWDQGFNDGHKYWEEGEEERKKGNIEKAIQLFDEARYNGYLAPALYNSYALAFRKLNDLNNEIAIWDEAIERLQSIKGVHQQKILRFEEQREKAIEKLTKNK